MLNRIKKFGTVYYIDLIDLADISIKNYYDLSSYLKHNFADFVSFNSKTKEWSWIGKNQDAVMGIEFENMIRKKKEKLNGS